MLITGTPGSGKSRLAQERFLRASDALLLTPSSTMAEHLRHEFARRGVAVRPSRVTTLAQFVDSRCADAAAPPALIHLLIREALAELQPQRFTRVADYPGLHRAIAALMDEAPASAVPADLARIFRHVESGLTERGMALRTARLASVSANAAAPPAHIVIDGFFSFSPAELALLESLSRGCSFTVTLPAWPGADASRSRLLSCGFNETVCEAPHRRAPRVAFSAATLDREVEEIARRILDHAAQGRAFREMGIILRTREPYGPALETAFARFGIPARFYFADPLAMHPVVEYFSRLVQALLDGWDHAALLTALSMPVSGIGATPAGDAFDFELRKKLPGRGLALPGIQPDALALLKTLPSARDRMDPKSWASQFKKLRATLPPNSIDERMDRSALNRLGAANAAAGAFDEILDQTAALLDDKPIALADFWNHIKTALELEPLRVADRRRNVVHIMDVFEARQWELPIVFVCGMVERHFPQYHRENPLMNDAARLRAGLKTSAELQREERFLFEIATTRATEQTNLSFARFDEKGEEWLRSFLVEDVNFEFCEARIRPRPSRQAAQHTSASIHSDAALAHLGILHRMLAATSIESFLQCPFQFFAAKTLRLNPRPPAPRDRLDVRLQGTILHRALAEFSKMPLLGSAILDEVFEDECRGANIPLTYRAEAVRLELRRNFDAFVSDRQVALDWSTRVEEKFSFALNPLLVISGRIDRLDIGPRNQALVIDYKYSAGAKIRERVDDNSSGNLVQGGLYLAAAQRAFGLEPAGMLYCGLRKDVVWDGWHAAIAGLERIGESRTREALQELVDDAIAKAAETHEAITSGRIAPHPADDSKCLWCDFRDMCRIESTQISKAAGESRF